MSTLEEAIAALSGPDALSIFADIQGDPIALQTTELDAASEAFVRSTAGHLARIKDLVDACDVPSSLQLASRLGDARLAAAPHRRPRTAHQPLVSGVLIEELPDADDGATVGASNEHNAAPPLGVPIMLAVSLYAQDPTIASLRPWTYYDSITLAAHNVLEAMCTKQIPEQSPGAGCPPLSSLVASALPGMVEALRPTLLAPSEHAKNETSRLEPYNGPDNWTRLIAAGQLSWAVRRLDGAGFGDIPPLVLHPVLAAMASDASPNVQACGLWALCHVATSCADASTFALWRTAGLVDTVQAAIVAGDERAWPAAAAAAGAVGRRLAGDADSGGCHNATFTKLFQSLLEEGERHAHKASRTAVWLKQVPQLFRPQGVQLCRYFARLMPLLLEWCCAPRSNVRLLALRGLREAIHATWPRIPSHARVLWAISQKVYEQEHDPRYGADKDSEDITQAAVALGADIWRCGGPGFRQQLSSESDAERCGGVGNKHADDEFLNRVLCMCNDR